MGPRSHQPQFSSGVGSHPLQHLAIHRLATGHDTYNGDFGINPVSHHRFQYKAPPVRLIPTPAPDEMFSQTRTL